MIGDGKGTGSHIYEGAAKPDDPVFNEGWSIYMPQQSGRRSSRYMPQQSGRRSSSSTPDKIDAEAEPENVMRDPMTGKAIRCRYCNSAEVCPHLLALINWDTPGSPSGRCAERFGEFRELVKTAFLDRLQSGVGRDSPLGDPRLDELWQFVFDGISYGGRFRWDEVVFTQLVIDMFDRVGGEKYSREFENAPGPGLATVWTLYYAKNPAVVFDVALSELKNMLTTGCESVDVSRPSRGKRTARRRK